jgi:hypothetical protein
MLSKLHKTALLAKSFCPTRQHHMHTMVTQGQIWGWPSHRLICKIGLKGSIRGHFTEWVLWAGWWRSRVFLGATSWFWYLFSVISSRLRRCGSGPSADIAHKYRPWLIEKGVVTGRSTCIHSDLTYLWGVSLGQTTYKEHGFEVKKGTRAMAENFTINLASGWVLQITASRYIC